MKKQNKLKLSRQTIRILDDHQTSLINGGVSVPLSEGSSILGGCCVPRVDREDTK